MCTVFFGFFSIKKLLQGHVLLKPSQMFSQTCLGPCLCQQWCVWVAVISAGGFAASVCADRYLQLVAESPETLFFCPHPEVCLCVCAALSDSVFLSLSVFTLTGQSGLGKSTLMNTLFKSKVSRRSVLPASQEKIPKTVEIKSISHGMETTFSSCLSAQRLSSSPPTVSHPPLSVYIFLLCQPHIVRTACLVAPNNTVAVPYLFSLCTPHH